MAATTSNLPRFFPLLLLLLFRSPALVSTIPSDQCNKVDQKALLAIKSFWGNPSLLSSWGPSTPCCSWTRVSCADGDRVTSIQITDTTLSGRIPPALAELPFLTDIILNNNRLTGPIPSSIVNLRRLQYINLASNRLTGAIPPELGSLPQLDYVDLSRNRLTGPVPSSFGKLRAESALLLYSNLLTGTVPGSFGAVDFGYLDLSRNRLSGDASFLFQPRESLQPRRINIAWNAFRFDLSRVGFPPFLRVLNISHNRIYGSIPKQIASLSILDTLDLSYNSLCGEIPTGSNFDQFGVSSYANNQCLCGKPLPPCK